MKKIVDEEFEKHMHDGHRQRMFKTVSQVGLETLSEVQVLEFMLFYVFPRGDVNPLAHRLLQRFMSISAVLDAPLSELAEIKGVGLTGAMKITAFPKMFSYYTFDRLNINSNMDSLPEFLEECDKMFMSCSREYCYAFGVDTKGNILKGKLMGEGNESTISFSAQSLLYYIAAYNPIKIILAHNHPKGSAKPSQMDIDSSYNLDRYLQTMGCTLHDSFIFGEEGIYSIKSNGLIKTRKSEQLTDQELPQSNLPKN